MARRQPSRRRERRNACGGAYAVTLMTPRTIAILAAPLAAITLIVVVLLLIVGLPWWIAILLPIVLAAVAAFILYNRADAMVSARIDGTPATIASHPRYLNLVEELCVRAGLREPSLEVVESESINALSYGASSTSHGIAVTTGALKKLNVVQLEGLLAREIGRLRRGDTVVDTLAVPFIRLPLGPFGSLGTKVLQFLRGDDQAPAADMAGMELTRYPPGLIEAFTAMRDSGDPASARGAVSHLWTRMPERESTWTIDDRIALLREL